MPPNVEYLETFIKSVTVTEYKYLTVEQIKEDTETVDGQFYQLPKTKLIVIQLWTPYFNKITGKSETKNWTTMRFYTQRKFQYYKENVGVQVKITIEGKEKLSTV